MIVEQISVFVENKAGSIEKVTKVLADANIGIRTFCTEDGSDFGILRMLVSDPEKAESVLKENGFSAFRNKVVAAKCANKTGSLSYLLNKLSEKNISVEYMYAFQDNDEAKVVLRTKDIELCNTIIEEE